MDIKILLPLFKLKSTSTVKHKNLIGVRHSTARIRDMERQRIFIMMLNRFKLLGVKGLYSDKTFVVELINFLYNR